MTWRGRREGGVPASLPGQDGSVVLVADDDRDVRAMLRTLLELDGHADVLEAPDGEVAWDLIVAYVPPVVVADIQMPGLDGLQLCRKIRESKLQEVKVIVYTAGMASEEEARSAGCDSYFLKTDPLNRLRYAVRRYTAERASPR
jgi:two-component system response regulator ResD